MSNSQALELAQKLVKTKNFQPEVLRKSLDKDYDGKITLGEFKKAIIGTDVNAVELVNSIKRVILTMKISVDDVFNKYDTNKTNFLNFEDFTLFMRSLNLNLSFIQIQSIFDLMAEDDKGKLTRDDIFEVLFSKEEFSSDYLRVLVDFKLKVVYYSASFVKT